MRTLGGADVIQPQVIEELVECGIEDIRVNESLARHTTWKVGGPADLFIYACSREELERALKVIYCHRLPWRVLGRGSNLLVRDGGIRGIVIKLGEAFDHLKIDGTQVRAGGGYSTILLASVTTKQGLTGLEFAGGIPGNVGGAVYMNAGAHGAEISHVLVSAEVLLETGAWVTLSNEQLQFRYRTSILQHALRGIVTEATFQLQVGDKEQITAALVAFKDRRRQTQPLQFPCAGSVFRNPPGDYAGRLIQAAGLQGYRIGDAEVSTLHANFIINRGQATAEEIFALIQYVRKTVQEKDQIALELEVHVVGEER
jgi:UDP-N-acetylmuramate dehydrogenase